MNEEIKCKTHPDAPHGFVRNASHTEDRYVCECEYWEEPKVNKQIKELAIKAGLIAPYGSDLEGLREFDYRMFAELIVRECLDIAQDRAAFDGFPPNDVNHIIDEIKEHFGVEE